LRNAFVCRRGAWLGKVTHRQYIFFLAISRNQLVVLAHSVFNIFWGNVPMCATHPGLRCGKHQAFCRPQRRTPEEPAKIISAGIVSAQVAGNERFFAGRDKTI
jgi:hypothetical protein